MFSKSLVLNVGFGCALLIATGCNSTGFAPSASLLSQQNNPNPNPNPTNPPVKPPHPENVAQNFNIPTGTPKIDVLFVIDNSGSMADEQKLLADSFADFINEFQKKAIDFRIGMITTDVETTNASTWLTRLPGYVNPNRGELITRFAGESFLTNTTTDLTSKFSDNARVGTKGSGSEQGLAALGFALASGNLTNPTPAGTGFIREDALLSMIVLSDENEDIRNSETTDGRIDRIVNQVKAVKGPMSRGYRFDFLANINFAKPANLPLPSDIIDPKAPQSFYPSVYLRAAERTGSRISDIEKNFAPDLINIGGEIVLQGQSEFKLSGLPIDGTLKVLLNGVAVLADPVNGYVLHAARNTIELRGTALANAPGSKLELQYTILVP